MKFLIDHSLSPVFAKGLCQAGHDAVHVKEYGLQDAMDDVIFLRAAKEHRILVSADTDFGTLLSLHQAKEPSVILFRMESGRHPEKQLALLLKNLDGIASTLFEGGIIVFEETRIRIRSLPIRKR